VFCLDFSTTWRSAIRTMAFSRVIARLTNARERGIDLAYNTLEQISADLLPEPLFINPPCGVSKRSLKSLKTVLPLLEDSGSA